MNSRVLSRPLINEDSELTKFDGLMSEMGYTLNKTARIWKRKHGFTARFVWRQPLDPRGFTTVMHRTVRYEWH